MESNKFRMVRADGTPYLFRVDAHGKTINDDITKHQLDSLSYRYWQVQPLRDTSDYCLSLLKKLPIGTDYGSSEALQELQAIIAIFPNTYSQFIIARRRTMMDYIFSWGCGPFYHVSEPTYVVTIQQGCCWITKND